MKIAILLASVVLISMCVQFPTTTIQQNIFSSPGRLQVSLSDDIQKLPIYGKATSLNITIEEMSIGHSGNFVNVLNKPKTLDLILFSNNSLALIGDLNVNSGDYTQIKLRISNAVVKIYNYDNNVFNKTYPLSTPSGEIILNKSFSVEKSKVTNLVLDFDIPQSITRVSNNQLEYVMNPIINVYQENQICDRCVTIT